MMELTKEQLMFASECCAGDPDKCHVCPLGHLITCKEQLIKQMHRYNEELTEENEILRVRCIPEELLGHPDPVGKPGECGLRCKCQADTVRKMQTEIEKRCIEGGIYPAFVANVIDQIAKDMSESHYV